MPKVSVAKTELVRKYRQAFIALLVVLVIGGAAIIASRPSQPSLKVGTKTYQLEVAANAATQEKGLGGRMSLPQDHAMLFSFTGDAIRCFWMKDMHFPLDIVWLNSYKRIVHIESNVSPTTYPAVTFCPTTPAQYVIELNAGQVKTGNLAIGQTLKF